ncbi:MAG TPA: methylmalonyl-CoA epimerase [Candidatus Dormibacteraeota bacterium]
MIKKLSHMGFAVKDLDAAVRLYHEVFGLQPRHRWHAGDDRMEAVSFQVGDVEIELMQATSEDSPIARFIAKRGEGIHHVAYKVDDVGEALQLAAAAGVETIDKQPRRGGDGKTRVGFLHPKSTMGVLTELEEDVQHRTS